MGPIDVVVVTFPSAGLAAGIGPLLQELVSGGTLRVVDAILVDRDDDSAPIVTDLDDSIVPSWSTISAHPLPLLSADDASLVAEDLRPGEVAVIVVAEHTWPQAFARAAVDCGGNVGLHARIAPEAVRVAASVGA
ncbi:MAG: hypothetical protein JWN36_327 [Microbacteriaceae bacterium]|nr:hypothetical protein [Microbacteriaceae bacterium]